jgi:hypothetical protein
MRQYITQSNFLRITKKFTPEIDPDNIEIYSKDIPFLSKVEQKGILTVKQFLINSKDGFIKYTGSGYIEDSHSYVYEESRNAKYHSNQKCIGLNSAYKDIEIPIEIKYKKGSEVIDVNKVNEFRAWFKQPEITNLYYNDQQKFIARLQLRFQLENPPKPIELENGELKEMNNATLGEITIAIEKILTDVDAFYNQSQKYKQILVNFGFSTKTFLVTSKKYRDTEIKNNFTGYSDEDIRIVLTDFYKSIKRPLLNQLTNYWILKLNSVLEFDKTLLDQLEFKPCKMCVGKQQQYIEDIDINDEDDLPF